MTGARPAQGRCLSAGACYAFGTAGGGSMFSRAVFICGPLGLVLACGVSEAPRPPIGAGGSGGSDRGGGAGSVGSAGSSGGSGGFSVSGGIAIGDGGGVVDGPQSLDAAAPPPAAVTGISINGTVVAKDKVIVFLHIGHSNMAGRTTTPEALRPLSFETHPQLWAYGKGGMWRLAKEPLSPDSLTDSCGGVGCEGLPFGAGPGMSILRTALAAAPDAHVVSIGRGQSGTFGGYCRNFRKGGLLYDFVMGPAQELKGKVTFAGVWTMLGLSEDNDPANNSRFGDCMVAMASEMRGDLGEPDLPFLFGDWEAGAQGDFTTSNKTAKVVIPQLRALPTRVPHAVVIPTEGLPINPLDGHHYDLTGHKLWAERGLALLKMKGWIPWATQ